MAIDHALIGRFVSALYAADSLEQRFQQYGEYIRKLGYAGATYAFSARIQYELLPGLPVLFLHTDPYPLGFLEHYHREHLEQQDFTVRRLLGGEMAPMDWREYELHGDLSAQEIDVIRLAREAYGIKNAISIPVMLESRGAAGVSVISFQDDEPFKALKQDTLEILWRLTRLFHAISFADPDWSQRFIEPVYHCLSEKEVALLHYRASGKVMKQVEDETGIDYSVASNIMSNMRRRLGGVNTERLMYLFGLLSAFHDLPHQHRPLAGPRKEP
ncbi:MAG: autoinducer binding domain-containing protein [Thiothrix sp.]|nr:autoinducer binding domain-containing protein [Thiothrix sp.]HPQ94465.1 autoinducer binding domain-containing protein [Thiolinea sp.]